MPDKGEEKRNESKKSRFKSKERVELISQELFNELSENKGNLSDESLIGLLEMILSENRKFFDLIRGLFRIGDDTVILNILNPLLRKVQENTDILYENKTHIINTLNVLKMLADTEHKFSYENATPEIKYVMIEKESISELDKSIDIIPGVTTTTRNAIKKELGDKIRVLTKITGKDLFEIRGVSRDSIKSIREYLDGKRIKHFIGKRKIK